MKTQKSLKNGADLAVLARGNGFYYAIRRFVGEALEARRQRASARQTAEQLAQLPAYLRRDIDWPAVVHHEQD
ncbi:hypothetical protein JQ506_10465 [Shinella sp. PSBB067]|uniref:hypothetical protein n=1 Tax=Shinella sp. PSBB067 TaxID=2715959 RepID=UPI00193AE450|nr:hypothetical protein [Shinella sp. PSBB067]QRI65361.1 hypothetical protein JQ506_10465 [Shinella sp. PSBB067]